MDDAKIWNDYIEIGKIGSGAFGNVYKAKNKSTGNYVAIKEIIKSKSNTSNNFLSEIKVMKLLKSENSIDLIDAFETKNFFYIIMELCIFNLEDYMKIRKEPLSEEEIKDCLIQLNNILKLMNKNGIIHCDLKPSNILISLEKINKISIKLSDYGLCKKLNQELSFSNLGTPLTMAPEVLEGLTFSNKNDIWSLGVIIYYLLFKEYPYYGKTEVQLNNDIHSGKILKQTFNNELNDLINKMLCIDVNKRISWEDYFNHSFFKNKKIIYEFPEFNEMCKIHSKMIGGYCSKCKINICENCFKEHYNSHSYGIYPFYKIGMDSEEKELSDNYINEIENNLKYISKIKNDIRSVLTKIKIKSQNSSVYQFDENNNFKNYYFQCLKMINEKLNLQFNKLKLLDINIWIKDQEKINISL